MSLPFRCRLNGAGINGSTADLCLNGGVCRIDSVTQREYCECPPGYVHDFTILHFENCGMTDYAWGVMVGVVVALTAVGFMVAVPLLFRLRALVKRVSTVGTAAMVANVATILAVWIDGGAYEAMYIFLFIFNMLSYECLLTAIRVFATPAYAVLQRPMDQFNRLLLVLQGFNAVAQLAFIIPVIMFCRDTDPARFNSVAVGFFFVFSTGMTAIGVLGIMQTRRLKMQIDSLSVSDDVWRKAQQEHLQKRMGNFLLMHSAMTLVFLGLWINPVTTLALGSFPAQSVLWILMSASVPLFVAGFATLYSQNSASSSLNAVSSTGQPVPNGGSTFLSDKGSKAIVPPSKHTSA